MRRDSGFATIVIEGEYIAFFLCFDPNTALWIGFLLTISAFSNFIIQVGYVCYGYVMAVL
jgi:hypothetical protein